MTGASKPCVLMVEDNPADIHLLELALRENGLDCDIEVLHDGLEALAWVRRHRDGAETSLPHIAILDLNLPKHDGIEILEAMQHTPSLNRLPVLVLSSSISPRDVARVAAFPNTSYRTKPSTLEEYSAVVRIIEDMVRGSASANP